MILRLMLHLLGCKKETKMFASSGNRTRAARVAGEHSTTEPTMLTYRKASQQNSRNCFVAFQLTRGVAQLISTW